MPISFGRNVLGESFDRNFFFGTMLSIWGWGWAGLGWAGLGWAGWRALGWGLGWGWAGRAGWAGLGWAVLWQPKLELV